MAINQGLLSSKSDEWTTPRWLYNWLFERFGFTLDAAASNANTLCPQWYAIDNNGLAHSWAGERVFCNPPYSQISKWAAKFTEEAPRVQLLVALVPARVDTRWWHDHIAKADLVHFIKGRLRFGDSKNSAPFPSALAFWFGLKELCNHEKGTI